MITRDFARATGNGGGGNSNSGGVTPFFCKKCGRTVSRKSVKQSCDVCKKCRVRK